MIFKTKHLPASPGLRAPDGSDVRVLLDLEGGSMAHFELAPGRASQAVVHRTVAEIWYIISGKGEMWRRQDNREEVIDIAPGTCLTIPLGTSFQFRTTSPESLRAIAITMPPWPGATEADQVRGKWVANLNDR